MGEEPQLPMIPDLGDILDRKKSLVEKISTVLKCSNCKAKYDREFKPGDFTFKKLTDEKCKECDQEKTLIIQEIYSEWIKPKKK
ncbi:MAG: hypothetical protein EU533_00960 [Promethearchaeota archaeon]|nr:MAG: hypothetical protein EU533_00960 [Candidatus Lokiarchaeota archaeon]